MLSEIGSNFCDYCLENKQGIRCFFWNGLEYNKKYFKSGRNAIKALCRIVKEKDKRVLIPAYTCETVIAPFLDEGWEVIYYRIKKDLTIDENNFVEIFREKKPSIVFIHSYFGFDTVQNIDVLLDCKKSGAIIVEDMTQSLFSEHHLSCADYYVTSFRKFLAIPDGGALISENSLPNFPIQKSDESIKKIALEAFRLKSEYIKEKKNVRKADFREKYIELNALISNNENLSSMSPISEDILNACEPEKLGRARRKNYHTLYNELQKQREVQSVLGDIADGCVPLYLPIYIENRKELQSFLASKDIYCPVIWPKPSQVKETDEDTTYIYDHILCIPIDQRYNADDMIRIASTIRTFYRE